MQRQYAWQFLYRVGLLFGVSLFMLAGVRATGSSKNDYGVRPEGRFGLDDMTVVVEYDLTVAEEEAIRLFCNEVSRMGGGRIKIVDQVGQAEGNVIRLKRWGVDDEPFVGLEGFQQHEGYEIIARTPPNHAGLTVHSAASMGCVYALGDLQRRIRRGNGGLYLGFPEWNGESRRIFEYPFAERRGEYINIGYNISGITPHEWNTDDWRKYIDELICSRLNTVYFYIWIDEYTTYPASIKSHNPLSLAIHERVREMITYARRRGMKVVYMICPSFAPKDLWTNRPEIHAEIEYVEQGFSAVCLRAPGAMALMKDVWQHEMEWFKEADGIQIWFYDPGGCWCDKFGCKANQAKFLASDFRTFADLFRDKNPNCELAFNYWPIWVWEEMKELKYRGELNLEIKRAFSVNPRLITAVGAPDNDVTLPIAEREAGFNTDIFIFGANPESGYAFLIPNLNYHRTTLNRVLVERQFKSAFGHRLEAKTRMMATYAMGAWMWDPDQTIREVTNQWAAWKTGSDDTGVQLGEAILLLEELTFNGANTLLADRAAEIVKNVFCDLAEPWKSDIGFYPAMFNAIAIINRSFQSGSAEAYKTEFAMALREHPIFNGLSENSDRVYERYRSFLSTGWKINPF